MLKVVNYHYIKLKFDYKYPSIFGVTPEEFKEQLLILSNEGRFIHPDELLDNYTAILESEITYFLVTFDDGLREQYELALPILLSLKIPALFFVNSINFEEKKVSTVHKIHLIRSILPSSEILSFLKDFNIKALTENEINTAQKTYIYDTTEDANLKFLLNFKMDFKVQEKIVDGIFNKYFDEDEVVNSLYMSKKQLVELAGLGYLGSHTHSHYPLAILDDETIFYEINNSKEYLEKMTQRAIKMLSYPYGSKEACNDRVAKLAYTCGYEFGFTTLRGENFDSTNKLLLNRYDCNDLPGSKKFKK